MIPSKFGNRWLCPIGMAIPSARLNTSVPRPSGITLENRLSRCVECSCVTQKENFVPQAFLCAAIDASPTDILVWFCRRWFVEVTFQEMRAHLGMETQRKWSDLAIERTTPVLLGLFSLVTLMAHHLQTQHPMPIPQTAWYSKSLPTFSDAIACVRRSLWSARLFSTSFKRSCECNGRL
jgi:hypothetical protein